MTDTEQPEPCHSAWIEANGKHHIEAGGYTEWAIFDMGWDAAQRAKRAQERNDK